MCLSANIRAGMLSSCCEFLQSCIASKCRAGRQRFERRQAMDQIDLEGFGLLAEPPGGPHCPGDGSAGARATPDAEMDIEGGDRASTASPTPEPDLLDGLAPLDLLPEPRPHKFQRRGNDLMAVARGCRATQAATARSEALSAELQSTKAALGAIMTLLPSAVALVGRAKAEHIGKKRRGLTPNDVILLCRAAFIPSKAKLSLGVKHKRVIAMLADLVLRRQALGFERILGHCRMKVAASEATMGTLRTLVHLTYAHLWDETKVKRSDRGPNKYKQSRLGVHGETMAQRGVVSRVSLDTGGADTFHEYWLAQPMQVETVSAAALLPAIELGMAKPLSLQDKASLAQLLESVDSYTFMPVCDRASANLSILRWWGHSLGEDLPESIRHKVLYWPDTCGIHILARGKLVLGELREHTMRHFSISKMHRLDNVRTRMLCNMESLVAQKFRRQVGPPPEGTITLAVFIKVVFEMDEGYHRRGHDLSGHSQRWHDLDRLGKLVNGSLLGDQIVHHCWDSGSSQPCCESKSEALEKATVAIVDALMSHTDPVPAESRWTHLLGNLRKTLLRKAVHGVGLKSFEHACPGGAGHEERVDVDSEAIGGGVGEAANRIRAKRVTDYYRDESNMHKLAVFVAVLGAYDRTLLYPMLGGPLGTSGCRRNALGRLLHKETSLVGACLQELLRLLETWRQGEQNREPWVILEALQAPAQDETYMGFARSQVLRLASSVFRRLETKYSSWPFLLFPLTQEDTLDEEKSGIAKALLAADGRVLDTYSAGVRCLFPSTEELLSKRCQATLHADFSAHAFSTDIIERLHTELTHNIPTRAPGLNFTNLSREGLFEAVERVACAARRAAPIGGKKTARLPGQGAGGNTVGALAPGLRRADGRFECGRAAGNVIGRPNAAIPQSRCAQRAFWQRRSKRHCSHRLHG